MQLTRKISHYRSFYSLSIFLVSSILPFQVLAAAKPVLPSCTPAGPVLFVTPQPLRNVRLKQIGTKVFQLPNGSSADLNTDLQSILNTVVTSYSNFSPTDSAQSGECNSYLEVRSAVTNFQLHVADAGISFGFSPSGAMGPVTGINGKVNVQVGTISIDFSVWKCTDGKCAATAASTSTQLTAGVQLGMEIDFGAIKTGPGLVYNTPLGDVLRTIMIDGVSKLAKSPRINELPWEARVKEFIPAAGVITIDAGVGSRIHPNETFEVYAALDASGSCNVFQSVAYAHTTSVGAVASTAIVDQALDPRGVKVGDIMMVRITSPK